MSRTQKFIKNSFSMAILQIVNMGAGFIIPRVMLEVYGSEINGLVSSVTQFISYFSLVEAGISGAAIYALYKPLALKDHMSVSRIVVAARNFYLKAGYIFVFFIVVFMLIYPFLIHVNNFNTQEIIILIFALSIPGALDFFTLSKYRVLLTADQKTYVISIASIVSTLLNVIIIIVLAFSGFGIAFVRAIAVSSIFLRSFILGFYMKRKYSYINYNSIPDSNALNKRWDAFYLQILGAFQIGMPIVLATLYIDLKIVSVYTVFNLVIVGINAIMGIFTSALSSSFGEVIIKGEHTVLRKAYNEFELGYYMLITIIYTVANITIMPFIRIYTKGIADINYDLPMLGTLMVLNGLLYNLKTPQGMLVISAGLYKETRCQTSIQAAILVVFGIPLVQYYGLYGIMIASILSNLYRDIDLGSFISRKLIDGIIIRTYVRMFIVLGTFGMTCFLMKFISLQIVTIAEWFKYTFVIFIAMTILICFITYILEKNTICNIASKLRILIKKSV